MTFSALPDLASAHLPYHSPLHSPHISHTSLPASNMPNTSILEAAIPSTERFTPQFHNLVRHFIPVSQLKGLCNKPFPHQPS